MPDPCSPCLRLLFWNLVFHQAQNRLGRWSSELLLPDKRLQRFLCFFGGGAGRFGRTPAHNPEIKRHSSESRSRSGRADTQRESEATGRLCISSPFAPNSAQFVSLQRDSFGQIHAERSAVPPALCRDRSRARRLASLRPNSCEISDLRPALMANS